MPANLPLGTDVVDLHEPGNLKSAANPRYRQRVLARSEQQALAQAPHPRVFLAYWAAKEATFKALGRNAPALIFAHRRFVVTEDASAPIAGDQGCARGLVVHAGVRMRVRWDWTDQWVHCMTVPRAGNVSWQVRAADDYSIIPVAPGDLPGARLSQASLAVRSLAVAMLSTQGINEARVHNDVRRDRRGPPFVMCDGHRRDDVCLSLSHDGRFVAAAVATPDTPSLI